MSKRLFTSESVTEGHPDSLKLLKGKRMEPAILARLLHIVVAVEWSSVSALVNAAQQVCDASCLESQHLSVAVENS